MPASQPEPTWWRHHLYLLPKPPARLALCSRHPCRSKVQPCHHHCHYRHLELFRAAGIIPSQPPCSSFGIRQGSHHISAGKHTDKFVLGIEHEQALGAALIQQLRRCRQGQISGAAVGMGVH